MAPRQRVRPAPRGPHHVVCDLCVRSRHREEFKRSFALALLKARPAPKPDNTGKIPKPPSLEQVVKKFSLAEIEAELQTLTKKSALGARPQCDDCRRTLRERMAGVDELQAAMQKQDVVVEVRNRARDIRLSHRPDEAWLDRNAERFAAAGIVMTDMKRQPILPSGPNNAIRTAFRALIPINPRSGVPQGRLGPLCADRHYLMGMLANLAKVQGVSPVFAAQVDVVRDLALVWEGANESGDAFTRLLEQFGVRSYKHARVKWQLGLMTKQEADSRHQAGFLVGALKWSPLHPKQARLATRIDTWVFRELQIRTRIDRGIGVMPIYEADKDAPVTFDVVNGRVVQRGTTTTATKKKKGEAAPKVIGYTKAAVSYDKVFGSADGDDSVSTPLMTKVSADGDCGGQRRNGKPSSPEPAAEHATGLATDLEHAFAALSSDDAKLVRDHLEKQVSLKDLAATRGITTTEARGRIKKAQAVLCSHLSSYEEN